MGGGEGRGGRGTLNRVRADGSDCGREENKDAKLDGEERLLVVHLLLLLLLCEGIVITLWSTRWLAGDPASLLSESAKGVSMVLCMRARRRQRT